MRLLKEAKFKSKSPKGLANEIKTFLIENFKLNPEHVHVWSPEETAYYGWGSGWSVCAEEGPHEWAPSLTGNCSSIYDHPSVFCECYNGFVVNLYKQERT